MKILGIALLVLGVGLLIWGYDLSNSVGSEISQALTGTNTDKVMSFYIGGAMSLAVGFYLYKKY